MTELFTNKPTQTKVKVMWGWAPLKIYFISYGMDLLISGNNSTIVCRYGKDILVETFVIITHCKVLVHTCIYYVLHRRGGGHTVFGADLVGVSVGVGVTLSCLHDIS